MYVDIHTNYSTVQTAVFCCLFSSHEPKARLAYSVPLTPARDVSRPFVSVRPVTFSNICSLYSPFN